MAKSKWELPVAFYFQVKIGNEEFAFKEASGLSTEIETESVKEGGVNDHTHLLPTQSKHGNLVLKRALNPINRNDVVWIKKIMEGDFSQPIVPRDIVVNLLGQDGSPIYTWTCSSAYPVKWEVDKLDSQANEVLIETLEFAYTTLKRS
jgi:phage tail-like protein